MQVILLERVAKLGQMGEVVDVKPATHATILLPQKKALSASKQKSQISRPAKLSLKRRTSKPKPKPKAWPQSSTDSSSS